MAFVGIERWIFGRGGGCGKREEVISVFRVVVGVASNGGGEMRLERGREREIERERGGIFDIICGRNGVEEM